MQPEPEFRPEEILRVFAKHGVEFVVIGGFAATIHGSPLVTFDIDITPSRAPDNLARLSAALREMNARIWTQPEPEGIAFDHDADSLADVQILNLVTDFGRLDVTSTPAGTTGYEDLRRDALLIRIGDIDVLVASLADVVRSKQAAGRPKDERALPILRRMLDEGPPAT
jgi:hypothetical protein